MHYAMKNSKRFIESLLARKRNFIVIGGNKDTKKLFFSKLKSLLSKEHSMFVINPDSTLEYKGRDTRYFEEIGDNEELISKLQHNPSLLDHFVVKGIGKEEIFAYLNQVYQDKEGVIGEVEVADTEELLEVILRLAPDFIEENYSYLTVNYFLPQVLPVIIELGENSIETITEIRLNRDSEYIIEKVFEKNEEVGTSLYDGLQWTGYYPSFMAKKREVPTEPKEIYFMDDQKQHEKIRKQLLRKLEKIRKKAYLPVTKEIFEEGDTFASKFGGRPVLQKGEEWPLCQCCHVPMALFLQINMEEVPSGLQQELGAKEGYFQIFYCTEEENHVGEEKESWEPFSSGKVIRLIPKGNLVVPTEEGVLLKEEKLILGWKEVWDYPSLEELDSKKVKLTEVQHHFLEFDDWLEKEDEHPISHNLDKIGGYPNFIQAPEYPVCPECKTEMTFLLQLKSEENLSYMFGDGGNAYITICKEHPKQITMTWDCY